MDYLQNVCFLCFTHGQNLMCQNNIDSNMQKILESIIPEHALTISGLPRKICDDCSSSLNKIFKFRQKCLRNIKMFNEYMQKLIPNNGSYEYLSVSLNDILKNKNILADVDKINETVDFGEELKNEIIESDQQHYTSTTEIDCKEMFDQILEPFGDTIIDFPLKKEITEELIIEEDDEKENLTVLESSIPKNTILNQTKHDPKLYFCIYCNSRVQKFARHLQAKHKYEKKVNEFLKYSSGDSRRIAIINEIRSQGSFEYNTKFRSNNEDMLLTRRPKDAKKRSNKDYTPCPRCKNFYRKTVLFKHYRRCEKVTGPLPRTLQAQSRALLYENDVNDQRLYNEILPGMLNNEVIEIVRNDNLILAYAKYLCERYDGDGHSTSMIRQQLRQLGKFLIYMREIDSSIQNLESIFSRDKYESFEKTVRLYCGYNAVDGSYRAPSLVLAIGRLVKDCCGRLLVEYAKVDDPSRTAEVEAWLSVYRKEYHLLNKSAHQIILHNNEPRNSPVRHIDTLQNKITLEGVEKIREFDFGEELQNKIIESDHCTPITEINSKETSEQILEPFGDATIDFPIKKEITEELIIEEDSEKDDLTLLESSIKKNGLLNQTKHKPKLYFCIYCNSRVQKFARHLQAKHKYEKKVNEFLKYSSGDSRRIAIIHEIRSQGSFEYNTKFRSNNEDMLLARRPKDAKKRSNKDYTPCPRCKNFYRKTALKKHYRRCGNVTGPIPRTLQAQSRALLYENDVNDQRLYNEILPGMLNNEVIEIVRNDNLILAYAKYLCERYDGDGHSTSMIRQQLRQLGKFLIYMREIDSSIQNLESIFSRDKYESFEKTVRLYCGYNAVDGSYRAPSLVLAIGRLVKDCCGRLLVEYAKVDDPSRTAEVEAWLSVYRKKYYLLNSSAHQIILRNKCNKSKNLPLTEDIIKLNIYLQNQFDESLRCLQNGFDKSAWNSLSTSCLLLILMFNRERVDEVEKLLIKDYENRHNIEIESDFYKSLKESEKIFSKRYMLVEVKGRLEKSICVMISNKQIEAIDLLFKFRENADVHFDNPYVFGRDINKYFEGCKSLTEASNVCGAKNQYLSLRGTRLRKNIVAVSQALNLKENELAILAGFMGHNIEVHGHFYRLSNDPIHVAKICKLLQALDNNMLHKYKGKSLDDIDIDDLPNEASENSTDETSNTNSEKDIEEDDSSRDIRDWSPNRKRKKVPKIAWTIPEKCAVKKYFSRHLKEGTLPSIEECKEAQSKYSCLQNRSEMQIKLYISNENKRRKLTYQNVEEEDDSSCDKRDLSPNRKRKKVPKVAWTTPEKCAVKKYFSRHLQEDTLPSVEECKNVQRKYGCLQNRSEIQIKLWIFNDNKRRKLACK